MTHWPVLLGGSPPIMLGMFQLLAQPNSSPSTRISSTNILCRAPRTLLQLIATEMEEKEDGTSSSLTTDDRTELGVHQALLLAVENAFNYLLGISFSICQHFTLKLIYHRH